MNLEEEREEERISVHTAAPVVSCENERQSEWPIFGTVTENK